MRKTLAGIGTLSLFALSLAYCNSDIRIEGTADLAVAEQDLSAVASSDMSQSGDLATASDLAAADQAAAADLATADLVTPPVIPAFTVLRIGTGATALTSDATAGFLERRKIADGTIIGQPLALPTAAAGANKQLTFSGLNTVEGALTRSPDGMYLVVAGYAADLGTANVSTSAPMTYNRVIGRIDAANAIDTRTAFSAFSTGVRGAASLDGAKFWVSSDSGIGYTTLASTAAPTMVTMLNVRAIDLFKQNNITQLFASGSAAATAGINTVGVGTPTMAGATVTTLNGFTLTDSISPYGFVAFDRDNNGSIDQLYVANDNNSAKGGVQRWKLMGTTWVYEGAITLAANIGARAVAGYVANNMVILVATTSDPVTPRVFSITDAGGATSAATTTTLVTAAANTTYRGIALAPQ